MIIAATDLRMGDSLAFVRVPEDAPHHIRPLSARRRKHADRPFWHLWNRWHLWGSVIEMERVLRQAPSDARVCERVVWAWCGFGSASIMVHVPADDLILIQRPERASVGVAPDAWLTVP
ncbi:hypothetical protein AB0B45_51215 [Nonomuraea sp. NPDC049152]|uniref:hypothetical protein n=1 Tax=Nonomuraea sp. NPDC049152 TaxID=3154350 RepID=UPI0033F90C72